jgi:hypothetical protein
MVTYMYAEYSMHVYMNVEHFIPIDIYHILTQNKILSCKWKYCICTLIYTYLICTMSIISSMHAHCTSLLYYYLLDDKPVPVSTHHWLHTLHLCSVCTSRSNTEPLTWLVSSQVMAVEVESETSECDPNPSHRLHSLICQSSRP